MFSLCILEAELDLNQSNLHLLNNRFDNNEDSDSDLDYNSDKESSTFKMDEIKSVITSIDLDLEKENNRLMTIIQNDEIFGIANEFYK